MDSFLLLLIIAAVTGGGFLAWMYTKPGKKMAGKPVIAVRLKQESEYGHVKFSVYIKCCCRRWFLSGA